MSSREVLVSIALGQTNHLVGRLWCHHRKGRESASFEYDPTWLKHPERFALEPALQLTPGAFHTGANQSLFGAIGDSAPDRWGRILMRRAESAMAKASEGLPHALGEVDYLLGVNDEARQGALRFSESVDGPYLSPKGQRAIPPLVDLPKLLLATERFLDDEENAEDLRLLLAPGSSLGGARPKASVRDTDGTLAIAKFPRKDDEFNVVLWEAVALSLAQKAGITLPAWRLENIVGKPVIIIRRFDRYDQERIPFLSAMSMLGARDNEPHSYLEIVDALRQHGASPEVDMAELWRRVVFIIMISNTDDHLRNHGFLYEREKGWRMSPVYDINPMPADIKPRILTTTIDLYDGTASLDLALSVVKEFRLDSNQVKTIVKEVSRATRQWRDVAQSLGASKKDIDRMATAFEHEDSLQAKRLNI
ncbi:MAG: phosphatidylinositol kinase [Phycisphaeraceae bacterium]|nr:phosphatidylinositol kinase [Phycisphaeraceae bacterium]